MTLVLKSDVTLSSPTYGAFIPPYIGTTGSRARFNANSLSGGAATAVTALPDLTGNGYNLLSASGSPTINVRTGTKTISLGAGSLQSAAQAGVALPRSLALAGYFAAAPAATLPLFESLAGAFCEISMIPSGAIAAYGTGSAYPQSSAPALPGWHRIIATFDSVNGVSSITVDGVTTTVSGAISSTAATQILLQSNSTTAIEVVDACLFDHVLSGAEITAVDAALHALLPV